MYFGQTGSFNTSFVIIQRFTLRCLAMSLDSYLLILEKQFWNVTGDRIVIIYDDSLRFGSMLDFIFLIVIKNIFYSNGLVWESIVIRTERSLEIWSVSAIIAKYIEPDGMAVQVRHKKSKYSFWKKWFSLRRWLWCYFDSYWRRYD